MSHLCLVPDTSGGNSLKKGPRAYSSSSEVLPPCWSNIEQQGFGSWSCPGSQLHGAALTKAKKTKQCCNFWEVAFHAFLQSVDRQNKVICIPELPQMNTGMEIQLLVLLSLPSKMPGLTSVAMVLLSARGFGQSTGVFQSPLQAWGPGSSCCAQPQVHHSGIMKSGLIKACFSAGNMKGSAPPSCFKGRSQEKHDDRCATHLGPMNSWIRRKNLEKSRVLLEGARLGTSACTSRFGNFRTFFIY